MLMEIDTSIEIKEHPEVYRPSDDTYLLLKAVNVSQGDKVLEMGTGTGIIACHCAKAGAEVTAVDVNPYAIICATGNAGRNGFDVRIFESDLFSDINEKFDVLVFNPPYLPVGDNDEMFGYLDVAWNGGDKGDDWILQFIEEAGGYLNEGGRVYILVSSRNRVERILETAQRCFSTELLGEEKFFFERLMVYELKLKVPART